MSTQTELQTKVLEDFLHYFLPGGLLDYFEPVMAEDKEHHIKDDDGFCIFFEKENSLYLQR